MPIGWGNVALAVGTALVGNYFNNQAASKAGRSQAQAAQAMAQAEIRAGELIREGQIAAARAIENGNKAAAAAAIEGAKIAADAYLKAAEAQTRAIGVAVDKAIATQKKFWQKANQIIMPTIKQGRFAQDEIASMLGIPNSEGKIVPFDLEKLRQTPGYQFRRDESRRMVEQSAAWKELSSQQVRQYQQTGDALADAEFGVRMARLEPTAIRGAAGEVALGDLATRVGSGIAGNLMTGGLAQGAAQAAGIQGAGQAQAGAQQALANLYAQQGAQLGALYDSTNRALAQNALNAGQTQASLHVNQGNIQAQAGANTANLIGQSLGTIALLAGYGGSGPKAGPWGVKGVDWGVVRG